MGYKVVIIDLKEDQDTRHETVIVRNTDEANARRVAKMFCGKGFTMNRRPDLHSFDHIAVKVEREK